VSDRTPAERLDRALDALLSSGTVEGRTGVAEQELRPLLAAADRLRLALGPVPVSPRFEAQLASRVVARRRAIRPEIHVPTWLLVTGAVSSAMVGVGVTAFAVWRGTRRGNAHRSAGS
jgi:hypothetical protein